MNNSYNLSFITDTETKEYVSEALDVIKELELIDFMKTYNPPKDTGFMFSHNKNIIKIMKKINDKNGNHSGFSIAYTLRYIEYIFENNLLNL